VADRSGQAALIEVANTHRGVKRIHHASQEQFLWATNHYMLPEMIPYDFGLQGPSGSTEHTAHLPDEPAAFGF